MRLARRLVEVPLRRQGVLLVPVGVARPHDVATRRVDGHRRVQVEVEVEHLLHHRVPLVRARRDHVPLTRHLAESMLLVVGVVVGGVGLHAVVVVHRLEEPVVVGHRVEADTGRVERVHLRHAALPEVRRRAHAVLVRLVDEGGHDVRWVRAQFEAVGLAFRRVPDPLARRRVVGYVGAVVVGAGSRSYEADHARRDDRVLFRTLAFMDRELEAAMADAARRRDAVAHPQLVAVLGVRGLARAAGVGVQVDEPGHQVHAGAVDLVVGVARAAVLVDRQAGEADGTNLRDAVPFDHDVDGSRRRSAGAVDQRDPTNDQAVERAYALVGASIRARGSCRRSCCLPDPARRAARRHRWRE